MHMGVIPSSPSPFGEWIEQRMALKAYAAAPQILSAALARFALQNECVTQFFVT